MIWVTGANGLMGKTLVPMIKEDVWTPTSRQFDITKDRFLGPFKGPSSVRLIVHLAAYTDVAKAESEKEKCYRVNVVGTRNLAELGIPMLYVSTEYVFDGTKGNYDENDYPNPQNFYALTKLLGEYESKRTKSCIVRCLFKPRPFEHAAACVDQITSGDYVEKIAEQIIIAITHFDKLPGIVHIGTGVKSTYQLASETRSVIPITIESIGLVKLPKNTSLNTELWEKLKGEFND